MVPLPNLQTVSGLTLTLLLSVSATASNSSVNDQVLETSQSITSATNEISEQLEPSSESENPSYHEPIVIIVDRWLIYDDRQCNQKSGSDTNPGVALSESTVLSHCRTHGIESSEWVRYRITDGVKTVIAEGGCVNCHHASEHASLGNRKTNTPSHPVIDQDIRELYTGDSERHIYDRFALVTNGSKLMVSHEVQDFSVDFSTNEILGTAMYSFESNSILADKTHSSRDAIATNSTSSKTDEPRKGIYKL